MKKTLFLSLTLLVAGAAVAQPKLSQFSARNPLDIARTDEPIVLTREQLKGLGLEAPYGKVPVIADALGKDVPSQTDDLNGDGIWDELVLVANFKPNERKTFKLKYVMPAQRPNYPQRTHARLGVSEKRDNVFETKLKEVRPQDWKPQAQPQRYQMEGPGWENDKVAFRYYFDARNGKDIFGKVQPEMIIDKIGIPNTPLGNYHKLEAWGMDILKVGNSLGAGAIALVKQEGGQDALYPIGQSKNLTYEMVSEGPVRALVRLKAEAWAIEGENISSEELIAIYAGQYWYESQVSLDFPEGGSKDIASGVTYIHHPSPAVKREKIKEGVESVATYAKQSENEDLLGMALLVPSSQSAGGGEATPNTPRVTHTYYHKLKATKGKPVRFRFVSGWEKSDPRFQTEEGFYAFVKEEARKFGRPVVVGRK